MQTLLVHPLSFERVMYRVAEIIENDRTPSHVAEISFHPSGTYFAVTYEHGNEVRIFDSQTRELLQVLENPEAQIDCPHGVLITEKFLLVSNANNTSKPGTINVHRNGDAVKRPIQVFQTPFGHLHEPHSLALRHGVLVVTYAENSAPSGAVVSYAFNEETGEITGSLDKTESWFSRYGDPKGVCFNADGSQILVTFESDKPLYIIKRLYWALARDWRLPLPTRLMKFGRHIKKAILAPTKNGIAIFSISADGKIARRPEHLILRKDFCRLENVDVLEGTCAVTDTANGQLHLYDMAQDKSFTSPFHTADFGKAAPHAAKFSPDGRLLVISSLGRKIIDQEFGEGDDFWESPREDKIFVLER
ncbi:MAG TPA: WD40 repeat domain-containing protein, partial [Pseudolabrys sp.]|nr:WD40 repeat domain-containing protein [Pseudolabrys sp.]